MIADYALAVRLFNRDTRLLLLAGTIHAIAVMGIYGVLLNLYLLRIGYGLEFIGLINATGLLSFATFSFPAGYIARRWGMRRTMLTGLAISVAAMGLIPFADLLPEAIRGGWLATGNILVALGTATFHVTIMPYLMASTSPAEQRQAFSIRWALYAFGAFMGSILGGLLPSSIALATSTSPGDAQPFRYSLFLGSVLFVGCLWAVAKARELRIDQHATTGGADHRFPLGLLAIFGVAVFLLATSEGAGHTFFNVYLDAKLEITTFQIGVIIALARIAGVPAALAAPRIAKRLGNGQTVALGSLATAISLIPLALVPHWAAAGAAFIAINLSVGIVAPASYLFMFNLVAERWRLAIASTSIGAGVAGFSAIALGGGFIIARMDYAIFFLISAGITSVGTILFWALLVRRANVIAPSIASAGAAPD